MTEASPDAGATTRARIATRLEGIELGHRVRILLAVESGSRAWGFPSSDSDWDVRFLYVRSLDSYLMLEPPSDVIALPLTQDLDVNGWDLRKALALLAASNAVVLEWLASPVVYRRDEPSCLQLTELAKAAAHLPALAYHYDRLARRHWTVAAEAPVRFKTLFYAVRPALALAWMRTQGCPPPMHLDALLAGQNLPPAFLEAIERLRALKLLASEGDTTPMPPEIGRFLADILASPMPRATMWDRSQVLAGGDRAFFGMVTRGRVPPVNDAGGYPPISRC